MDKATKTAVLNMFFFETTEKYIYIEAISAKLQISENDIKRIISEYYETIPNSSADNWQRVYRNSYTMKSKISFIDAITGTNKNQRMVS